ncbi:NUDIX hydrolase [archaeon]|nr:NUDIX hydrolase [archaeon]
MKSREKLPYRKNCEGYFICKDGKIVARDTGKGYLELPGGGVDKKENPERALLREAYEEAGVKTTEKLKEKEVLHSLWDKEWAKTKKQKRRYEKFKGEELYFFVGVVNELVNPPGDPKSGEAGWDGKRTMTVDKAIEIINSGKPFTKDIESYRRL